MTYLESGKMNARTKFGRGFKDLSEGRLVANIHRVMNESQGAVLLRQAHNFGDPIQRLRRRVAQIVHHYDIVALLEQKDNGMTSNKATSTRHQDGQSWSINAHFDNS